MSDTERRQSPLDPAQEAAEFFGDEQARPAETIEPGIWAWIDQFLRENPGGLERLIPLLHVVQRRLGYLPFEVQEYVADQLGLSPVQVYGIVSFYQQFTTTPRAHHQFKVCLGTACFVRHAPRLLDALKEACRVDSGGISDDGFFNLDTVRCIGACGLAPAVMVDDDVHGNVSASEVREIVRWLRKGAPPDVGPADTVPPEDRSP